MPHLVKIFFWLFAIAAYLGGWSAVAQEIPEEHIYTVDELYQVINPYALDAVPAHQYLNSQAASPPKEHPPSEKLMNKALKTLNAMPTQSDSAQQALLEWQNMQPKLQALLKKEQELNELVDYMSRLKHVSQTRLETPQELKRQANAPTGECNSHDHAYRWPRSQCEP